MKYGEVTCSARSRTSLHRVPTTGNEYRFRPGVSESVQSLEDLKYFDSKSQYTVSETARGQLALKLAGDEESVAEAISELAYGAKQQLAKSLGIKANQSSEDLEEALTEAAEEIQLQMETQ